MRIIFVVLLAGFFLGCTKEEYMQAEVGETIPYVDSVSVGFEHALKQSPYSLFYEAWSRAGLDTLVGRYSSSNTKFTVLVPNNAAFLAAGWSSAIIAAMSPTELNDYLHRYILMGRITPEQLAGRSDNYPAVSLYTYPVRYLNSNTYTGQALSFYRRHILLALEQSRLLVNGKASGIGDPISSIEATLWPIDHVLDVPTKTVWEILKEDERFSLYVQLLEDTDLQYKQLFTAANGYEPSSGHSLAQAYDRDSKVRYGLYYSQDPVYGLYIPYLTTFFIPTNEAFHKAGFATIDDLIAFNTQRGGPKPVWYIPTGNVTSFYRLEGELATDTLLDNHHNWGRRSSDIEFTVASARWTFFYSNALNEGLLHNYAINYMYVQNQSPGQLVRYDAIIHYAPFMVSRSDGNDAIKLVVKNTQAEANIVESDIEAINGVIHVVDNLLVPLGF